MKKLNLDIENIDGNAFMLMGFFSKEARRAKWSDKQIKKVLDDCQSGDYDHLVQVLMSV